jgi:hypothetical protein
MLSVEHRILTPTLEDERLLSLLVERLTLMEVSAFLSSFVLIRSTNIVDTSCCLHQVRRPEESGMLEARRLISLVVERLLTVELKVEHRILTEVRPTFSPRPLSLRPCLRSFPADCRLVFQSLGATPGGAWNPEGSGRTPAWSSRTPAGAGASSSRTPAGAGGSAWNSTATPAGAGSSAYKDDAPGPSYAPQQNGYVRCFPSLSDVRSRVTESDLILHLFIL